MEGSCYLCGEAIGPHDAVTGDHVVPVAFVGKKQPKMRGFDYAGRIPTHHACNNHFRDEAVFKQAVYLLELANNRKMHEPLQSSRHPEITILPVTPDQVPGFAGREFKRFGFIDTRGVEPEALKDPAFYADKKKVNLRRTAALAAIAVKSKSAAALLVKRSLQRIPSSWRIYATPFEIEGLPDLSEYFGSVKPFAPHVRASVRELRPAEWYVVYQYRSFLTFLLFVLHGDEIDPRKTLSHPECEIYSFTGRTLNELSEYQWHVV